MSVRQRAEMDPRAGEFLQIQANNLKQNADIKGQVIGRQTRLGKNPTANKVRNQNNNSELKGLELLSFLRQRSSYST